MGMPTFNGEMNDAKASQEDQEDGLRMSAESSFNRMSSVSV